MKKVLTVVLCAAAAWGGVWLAGWVVDEDAQRDHPEESADEQPVHKPPPADEEPTTADSIEQIFKRVDVLGAALDKDPNDLVSREQLILAYLVDLNQPHQAVKYLNPKIAPALGRNVTLAAREASTLAEADLLALGQWYRSLAPQASRKDMKVRMLTRALDYTRRYLEIYTKQDDRRLGAGTLAASIVSELRQLGAGADTFPPGIVLALSFEKDQWNQGDDGTVAVTDISGRPGVPAATAWIRHGTPGVPGKVGTGVAFPPGSRADLTLPVTATDGLKTFTFAFWVKTTESGTGSWYYMNPTLLGYNTSDSGSRDFGITSKRGMIGYWSGLAVNREHIYPHGSVRINDGAWHHVALTNDGKTLLLYVDATVVSPKGLPTGQALMDMPVPLGATRSDESGEPCAAHHSGTYDELQLYNRALTAREIAAICRPGGKTKSELKKP